MNFKETIPNMLNKIVKILDYLRYFLCPYIIIDGFLMIKDRKVINNNFGDDINIPILKELSGKKVVHIHQTNQWKLRRLLCIGSIIENYSSIKTNIWGSGCLYGNKKILNPPHKIYAVRGKLTRQTLIKQGIPCPEVYGDPSLLLPYIYTPHSEKKYKYGFIPHYVDYDLPHVKKFREEHPEILFINFKDYTSWQNVIEQIYSCEFIISSSLHGLIVSDAYKIPNVRVIFSNNIIGGDFKYRDYFSVVGKEYTEPINCKDIIDLEHIIASFKSYQPISFNPQKLLNAFPYKLKPKFQKLAKR